MVCVAGDVSQSGWRSYRAKVPITALLMGVHARSCVAKSAQELYDRYLEVVIQHR